MNQKEHDDLVNELIELNKDFIEIYKKTNQFHNLSKYCFDRMGNAIDYVTYTVLFQYHDYQFIKKDTVEGYEVSTVWLGINSLFRKPPKIFETMIFREDSDNNKFEDYQERYSTEEEALIGHQRAIDLIIKCIAIEKK